MNYRETMSRLNNALNNIDSAYAFIAKKHGLTFNALMMVCLIDESDNVTQKQICDALHLPKSTVHSILLDFIKLEYVTLVAGSNKKEKYVVFTEVGRRFFQKFLKKPKDLRIKSFPHWEMMPVHFLLKQSKSLVVLSKMKLQK
jgi:DNA-binding MarR family transcriptional regulator